MTERTHVKSRAQISGSAGAGLCDLGQNILPPLSLIPLWKRVFHKMVTKCSPHEASNLLKYKEKIGDAMVRGWSSRELQERLRLGWSAECLQQMSGMIPGRNVISLEPSGLWKNCEGKEVSHWNAPFPFCIPFSNPSTHHHARDSKKSALSHSVLPLRNYWNKLIHISVQF